MAYKHKYTQKTHKTNTLRINSGSLNSRGDHKPSANSLKNTQNKNTLFPYPLLNTHQKQKQPKKYIVKIVKNKNTHHTHTHTNKLHTNINQIHDWTSTKNRTRSTSTPYIIEQYWEEKRQKFSSLHGKPKKIKEL